MKIDPKDRSQLLRMAGNIAGGLAACDDDYILGHIPIIATNMAFEILETVDMEIAKRNKNA